MQQVPPGARTATTHLHPPLLFPSNPSAAREQQRARHRPTRHKNTSACQSRMRPAIPHRRLRIPPAAAAAMGRDAPAPCWLRALPRSQPGFPGTPRCHHGFPAPPGSEHSSNPSRLPSPSRLRALPLSQPSCLSLPLSPLLFLSRLGALGTEPPEAPQPLPRSGVRLSVCRGSGSSRCFRQIVCQDSRNAAGARLGTAMLLVDALIPRDTGA